MDKLEKLGYKKSDNHPTPAGPGEWTTQDERQIDYLMKDNDGNRERMIIIPKERVVWVSAIKAMNGKKNRIPAPLSFDEVKALYDVVTKLEEEYETDGI